MMMSPAVATALAIFFAGPGGEDWDLMVTNGSGKSIKSIELAVSGSAEWQKNRVDEVKAAGAVKDGARTTVMFDKTQCRYDLRATFEDGTNAVWKAIDVCANAYVTIRYAKDGSTAFSAS